MKKVLGLLCLIIVATTIVFSQIPNHEELPAMTIHVNEKWNMISLPLVTPNPVKDSLFPTATSNAFKFVSGSGYVVKDTLENGTGYWLKFPSSQFIQLEGTPIYVDTIPVVQGWNLIGSITRGVLTSEINTEPTGIIGSDFYGYNAGYQTSTIIQPGKGYWVKSSQNGSIILFSDDHPPTAPSNPNPSNGAVGQPLDVTLSWTASTDPNSDPISYDVYFGTDNPPAAVVSSDQTDTSLVRNDLTSGITYYWKVIAKDNHGNSVEGPVWWFASSVPCPSTPTVDYEGKVYNTVQIGTQCWLKENLDVGAIVDSFQNQTDNSVVEKYCYRNDTNNCTNYGGLYQWHEAMQYSTTAGAQGICPDGWHIPTYAEFQTLSTAVSDDGNSLKEIGQGTGDGAGTNTSGFSALLAGYRYMSSAFITMGNNAAFWSSTESYYNYFFSLNLGSDYGSVIALYHHYADTGLSVRCLMD